MWRAVPSIPAQYKSHQVLYPIELQWKWLLVTAFFSVASKDTGHTDSEPEIDDRVANLYGLTAEEMKTIRGD
jgi:hypothetical protein